MSIVSNASPLINLARIGQLELLHDVYGEILVPEGVWREVVVEGEGQPGAAKVKAADWIIRRSVSQESLRNALRQELDAGEAEAIVLALEAGAELLIMDERLGRETARHLGVRCMGLIGVLVESKHRGLLPAVKPTLDALRDVAGIRVSDALYARVLRDQGEA